MMFTDCRTRFAAYVAENLRVEVQIAVDGVPVSGRSRPAPSSKSESSTPTTLGVSSTRPPATTRRRGRTCRTCGSTLSPTPGARSSCSSTALWNTPPSAPDGRSTRRYSPRAPRSMRCTCISPPSIRPSICRPTMSSTTCSCGGGPRRRGRSSPPRGQRRAGANWARLTRPLSPCWHPRRPRSDQGAPVAVRTVPGALRTHAWLRPGARRDPPGGNRDSPHQPGCGHSHPPGCGHGPAVGGRDAVSTHRVRRGRTRQLFILSGSE